MQKVVFASFLAGCAASVPCSPIGSNCHPPEWSDSALVRLSVGCAVLSEFGAEAGRAVFDTRVMVTDFHHDARVAGYYDLERDIIFLSSEHKSALTSAWRHEAFEHVTPGKVFGDPKPCIDRDGNGVNCESVDHDPEWAPTVSKLESAFFACLKLLLEE